MKKTMCGLLLAGILSGLAAFPALAYYNQPESKKGLLCQTETMVSDAAELGVRQVIFNLPVSRLQDSGQMTAIDHFVNTLKARDMTVTMILLNDWQTAAPALLPVASPVSGASYYAFDARTAEGEAEIRRVAAALGSRYSNTISNWVIGNEVNNGVNWNYLGVNELQAYTENYAKAFRIFYEEIRRYNPEARVFVPFDYQWNCPAVPGQFRIREMLPLLNGMLKDTEYGIAWHAYPQDLTNPDFMNSSPDATDSPDTPVINMKNLNVLTDFLQRQEMRDPAGAVRHLILSEQGFSSGRGEELQAACIAQAYQIAANNPYVEGFFLNRQVDAKSMLPLNYRFGLWSCNESAAEDEVPAARKQAWYTYQALQ